MHTRLLTSILALALSCHAADFLAIPAQDADMPASPAPEYKLDRRMERSMDLQREIDEYPLGRGVPGLVLLGGVALQWIGDQPVIQAEPGLRYHFRRRNAATDGPDALSPWSVEWAMTVPEGIAGNVKEVSERQGNTNLHVHMSAFMSMHLAVQRRFSLRKPLRMTPELSIGIARADIESYYDRSTSDGFSSSAEYRRIKDSRYGPHVRLGLPVFANDWLTFQLVAGYVHFPNKFTAESREFDFTLSGFSLYPRLLIYLGHLRPAVRMGQYLPANAIPVWALAAYQTEKTSPVIAPPEVWGIPTRAQEGKLVGNAMFQYKNRWAKKVEIMGDFTQWRPESMLRDQAGIWITVKDLAPGTYCYNYVVNGRKEIRDPWNGAFDRSKRPTGCSLVTIKPVYRNP